MSGFTPVNQVRLTNVAYVRLHRKSKRFEIACYRNKVLNWRNKIETDIREVLQIDTVFSNVSKGTLASSKDLIECFGTADQIIVCQEILNKGELQVSEQERAALNESVFKDIATIVADKTVNPENNRPYTLSMIQNAMRQIQYSVNMSKSSKSQALDVIRRLREVMPIARANMLLRIICLKSELDSITKELTTHGVVISQDTIQAPNDSSGAYFDVKIDPELFRKVEEVVKDLTNGMGRVEVIQLRVANSTITNTLQNASLHQIQHSNTTNHNNEATAEELNQKHIENISKQLKNSSLNNKDNDKKPDKVKNKSRNNDIHRVLLQELALSSSNDELDNNKGVKHQQGNDDDDDNEEQTNDDENEVTAIVKKKILNDEELAMKMIKQNKKKNKKKEKQNPQLLSNVGEEDSDIDNDENNDDHSDVDTSDVKDKQVKSDSKTIQPVETAVIEEKNKNKKSKKSKRMELELMKEREQKALALKQRFENQQLKQQGSQLSSSIQQQQQDVSDNKNEKKSSNANKGMSENITIASVLSSNITSNTAATASSSNNNNNTTASSGNTKVQSCNTCGGAFSDPKDYRNHFKSEWHRYNLNRKMKNLPIVESEEAFLKLSIAELGL